MIFRAFYKIRKNILAAPPRGPLPALSKKSPYVETPHKVSGMMLANHTSIRNLFKVILEQYKKFRKRGAQLHHYKETKIFEESYDEFDQSEETVIRLIEEYQAAENEDYINWGATEDMKHGGGDGMDYQ